MSELTNTKKNTGEFKRCLLGTVSIAVLFAVGSGSREAEASDQDTNRATVWIELGVQMDHISGQGDPFAPPFLAANPESPVLQPVTPLQAQRPIPFNFGEKGKISIQPTDSDWMFSASVNVGRSSNIKRVDHQTDGTFQKYIHSGIPSGSLVTRADFAETQVHREQSHVILDFVAGRDVGLGIFGGQSSSTLNLGVRFAQLTSKTSMDLRALPNQQFYDLKFPSYHVTYLLPHFNTYHVTGKASRSFQGIGPSLSWTAGVPFVGNAQDGEVSFEWGANASILFGKQKANVNHHESAHYYGKGYGFQGIPYALVYDRSGGHTTRRSVIVPNIGGLAGLSYRIENFKLSAGYRADFFFGAIDGGIDSRKSETLGFYGPFATVSIGLGG